MRREFFICLVLTAATLLVYWQLMNYEFINYDDNVYVTDNLHVQEGLSHETVTWAFTTTRAANWHPLTWLSHMLDCQLYGLDSAGHHLTSLIFHLANTILLFLALRLTTRAPWQSAFVAALFALHPLHVESVAWVAERKDVLAALFWMLTMLAYVHYVQRPGVSRYLLIVLSFALGLMAKPMLVTLPFVLLLLDFWPLGRFQPGSLPGFIQPQARTSQASNSAKSPKSKLIWEKVPLIVLAAISSIVTFFAQQQKAAISTLEVVSLKLRLANGLVSYLAYIKKMIWPQGLAVFYPHLGKSLPSWQSVGAGLLLVAVSIVVLRGARRYPYVLVGWLWYLGTLVPVIGLVQVGEQAMADRYTYVPLVGLFIIIAWGVADIVKGWQHRRIVTAISAAVVLSSLMMSNWLQVRHWKDSVALFKHTLKVTSNNYVAHYTLGNALALQGNLLEAIANYNEALRIKPSYAEAHHNLGNALSLQGSVEEAVAHYNEALRIKPNYAEAHRNLGVNLDQQGKHEEAIKHYAEALRVSPNDAQSHNNLGVALAEQGRLAEATVHFSEAVRIKPDFTEAQRNLELGLRLMGRSTEPPKTTTK
jgi:tetratricopeptide (TPR) repeat protein